MNIDQKIDEVVQTEGGYTNDPKDSGGETNWGWTVATARAFGYQGAMKDMTQSQAKVLYKARFWEQPHFDQVEPLNAEIAFELFDTGVNMGPSTAVKFLQRALNVLNKNASIYPDVEVDGGLGKISLACLDAFLRARGAQGVKVLLQMLNAQQSVRYLELAEARPKDEAFEFGWQANRVVIL